MKIFIKENWFKLVLLILLFLIVYYLSQIANGIVIYDNPYDEKYLNK